jgi:hypothetical protein
MSICETRSWTASRISSSLGSSDRVVGTEPSVEKLELLHRDESVDSESSSFSSDSIIGTGLGSKFGCSIGTGLGSKFGCSIRGLIVLGGEMSTGVVEATLSVAAVLGGFNKPSFATVGLLGLTFLGGDHTAGDDLTASFVSLHCIGRNSDSQFGIGTNGWLPPTCCRGWAPEGGETIAGAGGGPGGFDAFIAVKEDPSLESNGVGGGSVVPSEVVCAFVRPSFFVFVEVVDTEPSS